MLKDFLNKSQELEERGEPFAMAIVVRYEAPISGKPGNKAIIERDGTIHGWIAGGCSQPIIVETALRSLKDGQSRLIRISPEAENESLTENGIMKHKMTCHSGGSLDVYVEPVIPKPQLIIMGKSAVGQALVKLGRALDYTVHVMAPEATAAAFAEANSFSANFDFKDLKIGSQSYVVVATQGEGDEEALDAALKIKAKYLAFVASRKKAEVVFQYLESTGFSQEQVKQIKAPAGLDIKARLPDEVALSILAEIISELRTALPPIGKKEKKKSETATDPICGMSVDTNKAKHISQYQEATYYFCCASCKQAFENEPDKYVTEMI